ncbi:MAG: DNA translocase FtsK, partial [Candidatus Gribaldobacteria bacterium]|nr:DNA translocase FtsK [Candidatus Gribaldobacteria bacterium]
MAKKKRKNNTDNGKNIAPKDNLLSARVRRWIGAIVMIVLAVVMALAFFHKSGAGGNFIVKNFRLLIGQAVFVLPFLLLMASFLIIRPKKRVVAPLILALIFLMIGIAGLLTLQNSDDRNGGWLGAAVSWPLLKYFSVMVGFVVFAALIVIGILIIWELLPKKDKEEKLKEIKEKEVKEEKQRGSEALLVAEGKEEPAKPKLEIKTIDLPKRRKEPIKEVGKLPVKLTPEQAVAVAATVDSDYKRPPLNLFDTEEEKPASGDTNYSGAMIQKTLANFGIPVEMSEVNIGPTVTQYTLKPAEGVKLAKITALSNDLALSLAAHPIRIEAPIPGRSLVGIEVPNKIKAKVKLGTLIANAEFQKNTAPLYMGLGLDVMGAPMFGNLGGMPHLLVAGATGSGKTICLNSLIMSLIYRNSPKVMRLILIDPKRVEFHIYGDLPHLLTPVILNARKAVNALNWLVGEMERRFEVLRTFGARDIGTYNSDLAKKPKKQEEGFEQLPYIVLVIDELADL